MTRPSAACSRTASIAPGESRGDDGAARRPARRCRRRSDPAQVARVLNALDDAPTAAARRRPAVRVGDRVRVQRMRPAGPQPLPALPARRGGRRRTRCSATTADRAPGAEPVYAGRVRRRRRCGVTDAEARRGAGRPLGGLPGARLVVDGVHDVGGMQGFGAACWPGSEEPTHADWELRAFVLALVTGPGSSHAFRHTIERLDPVRYLESTLLRALAVRGRAGAGRVRRDHARGGRRLGGAPRGR